MILKSGIKISLYSRHVAANWRLVSEVQIIRHLSGGDILVDVLSSVYPSLHWTVPGPGSTGSQPGPPLPTTGLIYYIY